MKKFTIISLIFLSVGIGAAAQSNNRNLNDIRKKFYAAYEQLEKQGKIEKEDKAGDGLMQQFRRWEYLMRSRTNSSGILPDAGIQWREWQQYQNTHASSFAAQPAATKWQPVGSTAVPSLGGGAGRINVVRFDPVNSAIIYIGAAGGGVWKTTNGGATWACLSDKYPVTSIADIAIDPNNGNNIYVATGDESGYELGTDFWGGVYTAGIMRSTDGGVTWAQVGINIPQNQLNIVQRLLINPANNKVLLAATRTGIYRSTNSGTSWKKVSNSHCYDMDWKPGDPKTVYAGGDGVLYKSVDAGATWSGLKTGIGSGRMSIEVCAAEPLVIYALGVGSGFFKTTDGGATWVSKAYPSGAGFYGYYDLMLSCSQANSNFLVAGGLNTVKSTNGGTSWVSTDNWSSYTAANYVHADKHAGIFYPGSTTDILLGTDGGIFKTADGGASWTDLSNGLMIAQIYRLGTTPQNANLVVSGWQDNGCNKWDGTNWTRIFGADGMEAAIDPTNQNTIYEAYQYGALQKSTNGGTSWVYIAPSSGDWVTPFIIDPVLNTRLYWGGYNTIYKTDNQGAGWTAVSGISLGSYSSAITVAPSNNNIIYSASFTKIYRKDLISGVATNITAGLPTLTANINYIAVSSTDPNKVWVALSAYSAGNKVFYSANGGSTWANISGSLPNMPVNSIVYQNNSTTDRVYIGTDIGVYVRDNTVADWQYFGNGLPNVMVHELEINYATNKLVAATYGRGIWQVSLLAPAPLANNLVANTAAKPLELIVNLFPNPTTGVLNLQVKNAVQDVMVELYKLTGEKVIGYNYNASEAKNIRLNISNQPYGNYIIRVQSGSSVATKELNLLK